MKLTREKYNPTPAVKRWAVVVELTREEVAHHGIDKDNNGFRVTFDQYGNVDAIEEQGPDWDEGAIADMIQQAYDYTLKKRVKYEVEPIVCRRSRKQFEAAMREANCELFNAIARWVIMDEGYRSMALLVNRIRELEKLERRAGIVRIPLTERDNKCQLE